MLHEGVTSVLDTVINAGLVVAPPVFGPPSATLTVVQGPGYIQFKLDGTVRWTVNVRLFAGSPTLTVNPAPHGGYRIVLDNARFPGTEIPADFVADLQPRGFLGTRLDLAFTWGGFQSTVLLERWLAGQESAVSEVTLAADVCPLGATSKLATTGLAEARFSPNWLFQLAGTGLATVSGLGSDIVGDNLAVKLVERVYPSISLFPRSRRTLLTMSADGRAWPLKPAVVDLPIGTLEASNGLFDRIDIEASESATAAATRVLVASTRRPAGLALAVASGVTDLDGQPLKLALRQPIYAVAFDPSSDHSVGDRTWLSAHFSEALQWLSRAGVAMEVGDGERPGFEADTLDNSVTAVRCEPVFHAAAASLTAPTGEIVATRPLPVAAGLILPIVATPGATPGWGVLAGPAPAGQPEVSLPDFGVSILRPTDLLFLNFAFYNLALEVGKDLPLRLVRLDATQQSTVVVVFDTPQNLAEQAFLETYPPDVRGNNNPGEPFPSPPAPVQVRAAGPSRLAFHLPNGTDTLAYSFNDLLDWPALQQSVVPVALPDAVAGASAAPAALALAAAVEHLIEEEVAVHHLAAADRNEAEVNRAALEIDPGLVRPRPPRPILLPPAIREPGPTETAIEAPWRVFLSPNSSAAWKHSTPPVTADGRTELWHTRLAVRAQGSDGHVADETLPRKVRAVWSPDYRPHGRPGHHEPPAPFRTSLDSDDRDQIVRLSSDFTIAQYHPASINAGKLFLSALGAWLDLLADFNLPPPSHDTNFSLEQWRHLAAMARDNYVRVVYAGFLCPGGHRASLVKVTERKFQPDSAGRTTAFLRQRFFIVVREPVKDYHSPQFLTDSQRRGFPYQSLRITTLVTPTLDAPKVGSAGQYSFFPQVAGQDFLFHLVGTDGEQQPSEFTSPLYFIERGAEAGYDEAVAAWTGSGRKDRDLAGQKIAFAAPTKPGDTTMETAQLTIEGERLPNTEPPFFPQMSGAEVSVPAIQQVTGKKGPASVKFYSDYQANDFKAGGVFLELAGAPTPVTFSGEQSGG
ncbi:MAG: hypothetical protein QOK39_970, partial [Acidimicrobiaceae bacterium]|nr:hypothetical protein [Acidimicrobiaceae bacterium]